MITKYRLSMEKQLRQMSLQRKIRYHVYYSYALIDRLEKELQAKEKEEFYSLPEEDQIKIDIYRYFEFRGLKRKLQNEKKKFNHSLKTPIKIN